MHSTGQYVQYRSFLADLMKLEFSRHTVEKKYSYIKFHEKPSSESQLIHTDARTDRHDEGNSIAEEIKSRLRLGNACYHSVQNLLSSRFLSKNLKIKIHRTIILPVVLYGCETWSLTLQEERKLRVFENMVLRRIRGTR